MDSPDVEIRATDGFFQWRDQQETLTKAQLQIPNNDMFFFPSLQRNPMCLLKYNMTLSSVICILYPPQKNPCLRPYPLRYQPLQHNDINVYLTEGQYELVLRQTLPWSPQDAGDLELPCVEFDLLSLSRTSPPTQTVLTAPPLPLSPMTLTPNPVVPSHTVVPSALDPSPCGTTNFFLPTTPWRYKSISTLTNPPKSQSTPQKAAALSLKWVISMGTSNPDNAIQPLASYDNWYQKLGLLQLVETGEYYLRLEYTESTWDACMSFGIGLVLK